MSSSNKKVLVSFVAAAFTVVSGGAFAQDRYDDSYRGGNDDDFAYEYAKVVDVQPLVSRVRVSTPQRECWDETRYDGAETRGNVAGGTLLGAVIGAAIGNQIGSGDGRRAATAGGAIVGAAIGHNQASRRVANSAPPREYTVQRCETRYHDEWQERVDAYRVTYQYHGRRGVTELPYKPGERIRVRVDVNPA
jgi:uncharacterized protein YcfJ